MSGAALLEPRVLPRSEHPISRSLIDKNALKVLYRLHEAGHTAYLVGGGVRDLMLGRKPKDFDVATDAKPNEIRRIFRNARLIGRRFRLAHILFKEGIVEVSTFRAGPGAEERQAEGAGDLLITSDNVFGSPEQDAFRRDFTINALFYDIADFSVIDFVGGLADLEARVIRSIGDPNVRFREDPVRMMRACELAARLGFGMESETQEAIHRHRGEISRAATPRVTEELVELLSCGRAGAALQWMLDLGLLEVQLPEAYAMVAAGQRGLGDLGRLLPVVDEMVLGGRSFKDSLLLSLLLLPKLLLRRYDVEALGQRPLRRHELETLVEEVALPFAERFALAKARTFEIRETLLAFAELCDVPRERQRRARLAGRPFFRQALELFELLVAATGEGQAELQLWRAETPGAPRLKLIAGASPGVDGEREGGSPPAAAGKRSRSRRRRRRASGRGVAGEIAGT